MTIQTISELLLKASEKFEMTDIYRKLIVDSYTIRTLSDFRKKSKLAAINQNIKCFSTNDNPPNLKMHFPTF